MTNIMLYIPDGYEVEELPKSEKIVLENGSISLTYLLQREGNLIRVNQRLVIKETIFPSSSYDEIRSLWTHFVKKNSEQVVLKRVS